jgi:alkylated DNA repair protein alkB family protein 6
MRRLREFGGKPTASGIEGAEALPPPLARLAEELVRAGLFPACTAPNHALVNSYGVDGGILAHTDGPRFAPIVATLSLGDAALMRFSVLHGRERAGERGGEVLGQLLLAARSLVVTRDDLYLNYAHEIPAGGGGRGGARDAALCPPLWNAALEGSHPQLTGHGDLERRATRVSVTLRHAWTSEELTSATV